MNDKEAIVNIFELYMDGLSDSDAYSGAWSEHLPEVRLFCRLLDAAERTGYISVYSGEGPNDA